jgi:hypothetical protein
MPTFLLPEDPLGFHLSTSRDAVSRGRIPPQRRKGDIKPAL